MHFILKIHRNHLDGLVGKFELGYKVQHTLEAYDNLVDALLLRPL